MLRTSQLCISIYLESVLRYRVLILDKCRLGTMRWAGYVARKGGEEGRIQGFGWEIRGKETVWEIQAWMGGQY
jgi:hypothetical protein